MVCEEGSSFENGNEKGVVTPVAGLEGLAKGRLSDEPDEPEPDSGGSLGWGDVDRDGGEVLESGIDEESRLLEGPKDEALLECEKW